MLSPLVIVFHQAAVDRLVRFFWTDGLPLCIAAIDEAGDSCEDTKVMDKDGRALLMSWRGRREACERHSRLQSNLYQAGRSEDAPFRHVVGPRHERQACHGASVERSHTR
jgi:hypothetical protein